MRSTHVLPLIVCLAVSALPVAAQAPTNTDWSRVLRVVPGTEIVVIVKGSQPVRKFFVRADDSGLTVLNVADGEVVERLARTDVVEIKTAKTRGAGSGGAITGVLIGYVGGLVAGHRIGRAAGADPSNLGVMFWGGVGGGVAGGFLGYRVASRKTDGLIYRAPQSQRRPLN